MKSITPFLWFDDKAEEAMHFYTSIFKNSQEGKITRERDNGSGGKGKVRWVQFQLDGQDFMAINGGPHFTFSPAISFFVNCETQEELDRLWEKLTEGGNVQQCGWLKDKYGISWQIVPSILGVLLSDKDPVKSKRVMDAMLGMRKLDITALQTAYNQK